MELKLRRQCVQLLRIALGICGMVALTPHAMAQDHEALVSPASSSKPASGIWNLTGLQAQAPTPDQASLSSRFLLTPAMLLGSGSVCVSLTYDANGNRTAQAVGTVGSGGALWGSGSFGCFIWHP